MNDPITLPSSDELTLAKLRRRYEETTDAETRTRYQILLLSLAQEPSFSAGVTCEYGEECLD